jgi:hypothetical protein
MKKNTVAFMYDFDETLAKGYMQDHSLIPLLGFEVDEFWHDVNAFGKDNNMDNVLAYLYKIIQYSKEKNIKISREKMFELAKGMQYFDGVLEWFERINNFANELDINIEHYIISSGMREIIEGTEIAKHFKYIFACSYVYDEQGNPIWPCIAVNYTNKTQYLFRIRKNQMDDLNNSVGVNEYIEEENKLAYKKMFYFGDGMTDIPCMKLLKQKGGHSFAVFDKDSQRAKTIAEKLFKDGRANYFAPADYTDNSKLDKIVKSLLLKISEDDKIEKALKS